MDDLISRQAAIEAINKNRDSVFHDSVHYEDTVYDISNLPSAQKRGKWIKMSDTDGIYWSCSECGEDIPRVSHFDPQFDLFPRLESIEKTNFCPHCGADMRENSDNEIH